MQRITRWFAECRMRASNSMVVTGSINAASFHAGRDFPILHASDRRELVRHGQCADW